VLVGAQAVYLRVGDADIPVALYTTDGDIGLRPELLSAEPEISTCKIMVAGPAALLVAKAHKIRDRLAEEKPDRIADKDALDVVRLLRGSREEDIAERVRRLLALRSTGAEVQRAAALVTEEALDFIRVAFGVPGGRGCDMAVRAARGALGEEELRASTVDLARRVLRRLAAL
jgi:hypothetical protein